MKKIKIIFIGLLALFSVNSCTDLDETLFSTIDANEWYSTEEECLRAMGSAYASLRYRGTSLWGWLATEVLATDEAVVPLRNIGASLSNEGIWIMAQAHDFAPQLDYFWASWEVCFNTIARCNQVIYLIENSPAQFEGKPKMIAELRTLRAFVAYKALDLFGNIPLTLDFLNTDLPVQLTRAQAFQIIETELLESYPLLDPALTSTTYGRCIRPVAFTILAKMYLNAEKWIGTPRYDDAITMCDNIINSGSYILQSNYFSNFSVNNIGSKENIFVIPYDRLTGFGFQMHMYTLPTTLLAKFNYQSTWSWNGIVAMPTFYDLYDPADLRIKSFEVGPQFDRNGNPVIGLNGTHLTFTNTVSNILGSGEGEGARCFKWEFPTGLSGWQSMDNDWSVFRYSDILMIKAEAIMRSNGGIANQTAVDLMNQVRQRAFGNSNHNYTVATLTMDELLNERGRELAWEGHRRQDLIRFGKFGDAWFEKPAWTDNHKELYPIPPMALSANPNLNQNPGY
jgi:starch-binding outer membrane protein, SusD/RagB family